MNVIARLEFEPAYYDIEVYYVNHFTTGIPLHYLIYEKLSSLKLASGEDNKNNNNNSNNDSNNNNNNNVLMSTANISIKSLSI